jgi:phosphoglycolate phosphatase-like HAD superfamily hydrolase
MLRNVIWDVDGTLFDTYPAIARAMRAALNDVGGDAPLELITTLTLVSLDHCLTVLAADLGLPLDDLERAFDTRHRASRAVDSPPFPGVVDACRHIRAIGGRNVIVTHRRLESTVALLDANAMASLFSGWVTAADGYPRKPDPAAFRAAMSRFGLVPSETLTVGDREIDIAAGRAAGITTVLYAPGATTAVADLTIRAYAELVGYLEEVHRSGEAGS